VYDDLSSRADDLVDARRRRQYKSGSSLAVVDVALQTTVRTVHAFRPDLSLRTRAVVEAVLLCGGPIGSAQCVAPHLGLRNRFELARLLKREGLPPLHDLAAWASVLAWLDRAECTGSSLCELAFRARKDPATCYRTVKRVTGRRWVELRQLGSRWVIEQFVAHCRAHNHERGC